VKDKAGSAAKSGAGFKRHKSDQAIGTPPEFVGAVERRFGALSFDLAANSKNTVVRDCYFGPGSPNATDSLATNWRGLDGNLWLNPPYGDIGPWARKLADECKHRQALSFLLVPSSTGALWFQRHVAPHSHVIELVGRIKFVGAKQGYPKDLILAVYGFGLVGRSAWDWRD
jgi:phage N-6-adenine-methyltransferase